MAGAAKYKGSGALDLNAEYGKGGSSGGGAAGSSDGFFGSAFKSLVGGRPLDRGQLDPVREKLGVTSAHMTRGVQHATRYSSYTSVKLHQVLEKLQTRLVEKNVATDIGAQICETRH